jgi:hypothetical protein
MKRFVVAAALLTAGSALASVSPGEWEYTVETGFQVPGKGASKTVRTRCITEADVRDPAKVLGEAGGGKCELSNIRDSGTEYTFDVNCTGSRVPVKGTGNVQYTPQTLDGHIDLTAEAERIRLKTRSTISARRLGPCEK